MADNDFSQVLHRQLQDIQKESSKLARMAHLRTEIYEGRMTLGQLFECHDMAMLEDLKGVQLREILRSDIEKQVVEADISCLKEIDGGYCGDFKHHKGPCREDGSVRCDFLFGEDGMSEAAKIEKKRAGCGAGLVNNLRFRLTYPKDVLP